MVDREEPSSTEVELDENDEAAIEIPEPWIPPDAYNYGPIPGVAPEVMACMPDRGMVHEYVWWATQTTYAAPIFHIAAILPTLAWDLAYRGWQLGHRGHQVALQTFLIGGSASGKSTALRAAKLFHEEVAERVYRDRWSMTVTHPELLTPEQIAAGVGQVEWKSPWFEAEGTEAGILEALVDYYDKDRDLTMAILYHEEAANLFTKKDHAVTRKLLQLFDCVPQIERQLARYATLRRGGGKAPSVVRRPAISGVFASTQSALEGSLDSSSFEGGLVSRSIWVTGKPDMERWNLTDRAREAQRRMIIERWTQYARCHHALDVGVSASERMIKLAPELQRLAARAFYPKFAALVKSGAERLAAVYGRAQGAAELVAGLFAWSRGSSAVSEADMRAAVAFCEWSTRSVTGLADQTVEDVDRRWAERIRAYIDSAGERGVRRTDIYRAVQCGKPRMDQALATLIDAGLIVEAKSRSARGRPALVYRSTTISRKDIARVVELHKVRE